MVGASPRSVSTSADCGCRRVVAITYRLTGVVQTKEEDLGVLVRQACESSKNQSVSLDGSGSTSTHTAFKTYRAGQECPARAEAGVCEVQVSAKGCEPSCAGLRVRIEQGRLRTQNQLMMNMAEYAGGGNDGAAFGWWQ